MAVNARTLDISLSVSATNAGETSSSVKNILANLVKTGAALAGTEGYTVYSVAGGGNVVITPPAVTAGQEYIIIPYFASGESFATNKFHLTTVISGTSHTHYGFATLMAFGLLGTESSVTLYNDGSNTAEFAVVTFRRTE